MEADFQREYGIDLMKEIETMSFRRFCVLKNHLSSNSVYVFKVGETLGWNTPSSPTLGVGRKPKRLITDPMEAERVFAQWGK